MKEWTPNSRYGGHAFGFEPDPAAKKTQFAAFLEGRDSVLPWIKQYSPIELVSAGDPPIFMIYNTPPNLGHDEKDPTHSANFGVKLEEKLKATGVECVLQYPGATNTISTPQDFVIAKLKPTAPEKPSAAPAK